MWFREYSGVGPNLTLNVLTAPQDTSLAADAWELLLLSAVWLTPNANTPGGGSVAYAALPRQNQHPDVLFDAREPGQIFTSSSEVKSGSDSSPGVDGSVDKHRAAAREPSRLELKPVLTFRADFGRLLAQYGVELTGSHCQHKCLRHSFLL